MKNERKPKSPVVAAHSGKKNGQEPAGPKAKGNSRKTQGPRVPENPALDVSTLPLQNPYPVMRLGQDGQPLFGNPAATSLLGFSMDQSIPDDWREMVRSTLEAGASREMDIERDSRIFSALFVPVQQAGYVNVYCSDRTDLYRTQKSLGESEERFRQAADAAGALVYEVDLLSGATAIVHGLQRVVGYDPQSITPTSDWWHSLIHPDDLPGHLAQLNKLIAKGGADVCEYRLLHKNGDWIRVQDNRLVIQNESGQSVRLIGTVTDITARKQVEEKLRASEAELQDLIDQTPFMLTRCTRDLRYRFVSRTYAERIGRKPEDVAGKAIIEIMGEEGWKEIAPYVERVLNGERVEYELEIPFRDVGIRSLHVIYTPDRDEQGNVIGWFASITEVSTSKTAQEERNRALQREQWQREVAERAWVVAEEARGRAEQELSERKLAEAALGTWADGPLPQEARPLWLRYGMALVATGIAIVLRQLLDPLLGETVQYSLLFGALAFSVWYGGIGPAMLALITGYIGITWLILDWQHLLAPTITTVTSLAIFLFSSLIVMALGEAMQRAQRHAHQSAGLAVKRQREAELRLIDQQRTEQALRASEQRFREIFDSAGVSVWVEDFSKVKMLIEDLRAQGITDFRAHFAANPELVRRAIGMVNVLDVNQETLDLYRASSKEQLLGSLHTAFTPEAERAFVDELAALADGQEMYRSETETLTVDGAPISVLFTVHFSPLPGDYSRVIVTVTDITARKEMERALRASEEKYRRIVETANEGIWEIDSNTRTSFVNARMAEMLGYSVEEIMGRSSFDFVFPEDNQDGESRLDSAKRGVPNKSSEFRFRRKDGSVLWALLSSSPQMDERGNFLGSVAMMVDITQRKQIEQSLARERELFKRFFETMPVMSTIYDPETQSMRMNKYIQELTGWKQDDVTVDSLLQALYPDEDYLQDVLGRMAASVGKNEWVEARIQTRDGHTLDTLWANISIMDGEKLVTGISLGIDITEQKRMADAIRESEERYRAIVSQTTAGIAETNTEGALTFINPRFCEMLSYSESELLGKTIWELTYTEDLEQNKHLFERMLGEGEAYQFEKRFIRKDGSHLWTNVSVSPIHDRSGKPRGGVGVIIDIEKRKRAEAAILEYARQQAALFKLAEQLQHSHTPEEIYNATLDAILDALHCDRASILLFDETQRMRFVAWQGLSDSYRRATDGHSPWAMDELNPQPIYVNDVDRADFSDELKSVVKQEGIGSLAFIPLVPNGKLIGKFMVYFDAPHEFSEAELDLSLTIARQLAFDIARKRAEDQLRRATELAAFRVMLADTLRPLSDPARIQAEAMRLLGEQLQADRVLFAEVDEAAQVSTIANNYVREGVPQLVGQFAISDYGRGGEILRTGQTLIIPDIASSPELLQEDRHRLTKLGIASGMGVPILKDGRWVATWGVTHCTARTWSAQEIALLEETAERTWASLERARTMARLRASEALYRTIARSIPGGGVYVVDRDMRYLVVEGPVTEAFGLSRERLEGHTVTEVFPDERGVQMEDRLRRNFAGEIVDFETNLNGRVYWTQQAPLYDSIGQAIILTLDITERKRAEEELRSAREIAEQTADRISKLQEITSALAGSLTSEQLSNLILEQGTSASGAAAGIMVEVVNDGKEVKTVAALGYPPTTVRTEPTPLSNKTPVSDAIQTKQAIWLHSYEEFAALYPELAEIHQRLGNEATVALPLIVNDRAIGGLAFSFVEKREFLLEERGFLLALAQQCAQGLERVRATEALRESEQRFVGFMQHLPGLAWIKDTQGRYVFANDAAEKAFRVPRTELYGRTDAEVFPIHVADQFRKNDEQTLLEVKGIQVVEELEHEDGVLHYSLVNKFPILGSEGAATLIGGMAIDITESKQAEERLTLLAEISELARDMEDPKELMSAVADAVGKHLHVKRCLFNEIDVENDVEVVHHDFHDGVESVEGVHRVTDYSSITSAEMMEGMTVVNNDSKTDPRTAEDYERSYLPTNERSYVAIPLMRDDRWTASLWVSDDKPRVWSTEDVALLQTVAERTWTACEKLRIHGQLRDSEERLRVTFNMTAAGFAMLTPDTRFVDVNEAFCEIVGYAREELLTMNFDFLIHPDYVKSTRDNIRRLLKGKVPATLIEKLYIRKDGSQVWVQNNMSLVRDVDGDPLHLIVISQDISERKQIEALQQRATQSLLSAAEANAKFRTFFDQGSYFAGVMTLDGTVVEANRLSVEGCGYSRQDVIGKKFWDGGWWNPSPDLMDMVRRGIQKALEGETFRQESTYYIADGSVRYVDLIISPIKDDNGRIIFLAPTGTDITERKRTEEELRQLNLLLEERVEKRTLQLETSDQLRRLEMLERRQAQDRFAKSFNASPAAMSITRFEDGMYRNVNPKFIELLEYELDEIIGHTSLELKLYKTPEERVELLKSIRSNNGKWNYETQLSTKSDKILDVSISVVEIELDGEPHILSMIMDITERNQMLTALRASEQQLRTLFDVLPVGVAYLSQDRQVMDPNRTLERILGVSREDLLHGAHNSLQYIRPDGSPMSESEFASSRALREQRTINNVETGIIKEGGQVIWTSVSATPISMPEPGVVVITVDVTDRKHMDDELRRSHRRYQMLSRRLVEIQEEERRTISRELHDRVGQSLAALNLNLSFLNNSLSGTSSLQIKSRLKDAIQLTEETVSTIRDVMADLRPPALDDYGLEAALNAYTDTFSRRFGIRVALVKPTLPLPRLNPSIELTLLRITQEALTNVARHAKATQATVTLHMQDDMVYLTVEDNGEGIRSWQQANRPGSHGLKIMRERTETFGGTLQVQSFNKKGTRIEVKIPVRTNDPPTVRAETD